MTRFHGGKNIKFLYYLRSYLKLTIPHIVLSWWKKRELSNLSTRPDYDYIMERVDYYCKLVQMTNEELSDFSRKSIQIGKQKKTKQSVYYLDSYTYAKCFNLRWRWCLLYGDIIHVPDIPSIVKSRPLVDNNLNSVIMKMDKVRHFVFLNDHIPFKDKKDIAIWRGRMGVKGGDINPRRVRFVQMYYGHPMVDAGVVDFGWPEYHTPKISLYDHLKYKFIVCLEGNDVASNLKWVMSSNSVAVMPRPTCETWFMEGKLIPNYHYIEIAKDYSNVEERLRYYIDHPEKAIEISRHAQEWVRQFKDLHRERLISLSVMDKYLRIVNRE